MDEPTINLEVLRLLQGLPKQIASEIRRQRVVRATLGEPDVRPPAPAPAGPDVRPFRQPEPGSGKNTAGPRAPDPLMTPEQQALYGEARGLASMVGGPFAQVFQMADRALATVAQVQRLMSAWNDAVSPVRWQGLGQDTPRVAPVQQAREAEVRAPAKPPERQAGPEAGQTAESGGTAQVQRQRAAQPEVSAPRQVPEPEVAAPVRPAPRQRLEPEVLPPVEPRGTAQDQRARSGQPEVRVPRQTAGVGPAAVEPVAPRQRVEGPARTTLARAERQGPDVTAPVEEPRGVAQDQRRRVEAPEIRRPSRQLDDLYSPAVAPTANYEGARQVREPAVSPAAQAPTANVEGPRQAPARTGYQPTPPVRTPRRKRSAEPKVTPPARTRETPVRAPGRAAAERREVKAAPGPVGQRRRPGGSEGPVVPEPLPELPGREREPEVRGYGRREEEREVPGRGGVGGTDDQVVDLLEDILAELKTREQESRRQGPAGVDLQHHRNVTTGNRQQAAAVSGAPQAAPRKSRMEEVEKTIGFAEQLGQVLAAL